MPWDDGGKWKVYPSYREFVKRQGVGMGGWMDKLWRLYADIAYVVRDERHRKRIAFQRFQRDIACDKERYASIKKWAEEQAGGQIEGDITGDCSDPIVREGLRLRREALETNINSLRQQNTPRIMIQMPPEPFSPAGRSIAGNWRDGLAYIGVDVTLLQDGEPIRNALESFLPDVLIFMEECPNFPGETGWAEIHDYKNRRGLLLGCGASLDTWKKDVLRRRIDYAKKIGADFFYCYADTRFWGDEYREAGFPLVGVPFGANPLRYYPIGGIERDIDFVLLASVNADKSNRYISYLGDIVKNERGFIMGPGWRHFPVEDINPERDRYLYARAKVGLNLHIDFQIEGKNELNERTFLLASSGIPQVTDAPGLLSEYFSEDAFFVGHTPQEYEEMLRFALSDAKERERRALKAMREVYRSHTIFHRMRSFVASLEELLATGKI